MQEHSTLERFFSEANWKPANKSPKTISLSGTILDPTHVGINWDTVPGNQAAKSLFLGPTA